MKIAVFATCPKSAFSGGRYHAMMIAHVLARRGHEAYFVTNNEPVFKDDLTIISANNPVNITLLDDRFEIAPDGNFDAVFVAPQQGVLPRLYQGAIRFARASNAELFLINYESANWFNAYSPVKRPESKWKEWVYTANHGAHILSSAHESDKYARDFYTNLPVGSAFCVWQPAINSVACNSVPEQEREKLIVLFSRPTDKHKGGGDIQNLIGPELRGYKIGIIIGKKENSERFLSNLSQHAAQFGVEIVPYFGISDIQKFQLLKRAAAVVFPSYFEGYGYPPLEALASDTPCIAYDLPVIRETCGDRIRYAPLGDIATLRAELLKAIQSGAAQETSRDPNVISLTNVDARGAALEQMIEQQLERRSKIQAGEIDRSYDVTLSEASTFQIGQLCFALLQITSSTPIDEAHFSDTSFCFQFLKKGWNGQSWQYYCIFSKENNLTIEELSQNTVILSRNKNKEAVSFSLKKIEERESKIRTLPPSSFRVNRLLQNHHRFLIGGWLFPIISYDELYLVDAFGRVVRLTTGVKDDGFRRFSGIGTSFYGFGSQYIDTMQFDLERAHLVCLRNGIPVASSGLLDVSKARVATLPTIGKPLASELPENSPHHTPDSTLANVLKEAAAIEVTVNSNLIVSDAVDVCNPIVSKASLPRFLREAGRLATDTIAKAARRRLVRRKLKLTTSSCVIDRDWNILWIRGKVQTGSSSLVSLEASYQDKKLGNAVFEEQFGKCKVRSFRWRLEQVMDEDIPENAEITLRARLSGGLTVEASASVQNFESWQQEHAAHVQQLQIADASAAEKAADSTSKSLVDIDLLQSATPITNEKDRVLLIAHNLNAVERSEKRRALECLRTEFNKKNVELIILHHSKNLCNCNIPEINFFDKRLKKLSNAAINSPIAINPDTLDYSRRMLQGFSLSLNGLSRAWPDIETQTNHELKRVSAALHLVQPTAVLLWHQWNSLMLLAREVAEARNIPCYILHEGMLPGTMTIDANGMMAESDALGLKLSPDHTDYPRYMAKAERVIDEIRTNRLDRKPQAGAPAALQALDKLKSQGKKVLFYAGVNDWQSGNLPKDHARARLHAPIYEDTTECLTRLLDAAERLDFYVMYKAHPNLYPIPFKAHPRLIQVREANASDCFGKIDAFATLFSSLAYVSLAHGVPTILLGRNTLSETGAAYELQSSKELDSTLSHAFDKENLETRLFNFRQHVAALLRDKLYPYGGKTDFSELSYESAAEKILGVAI